TYPREAGSVLDYRIVGKPHAIDRVCIWVYLWSRCLVDQGQGGGALQWPRDSSFSLDIFHPLSQSNLRTARTYDHHACCTRTPNDQDGAVPGKSCFALHPRNAQLARLISAAQHTHVTAYPVVVLLLYSRYTWKKDNKFYRITMRYNC
ncbi:unnamed protein product, partial [Ectocarpus sp. 12 AP-2014]